MLLSATFFIVIIYTSAFVGKQSYRVHEAIEVFIRADVRPNHNRSLYSVQLSCTTMRYLFAIGKHPTFHRLTKFYVIILRPFQACNAWDSDDGSHQLGKGQTSDCKYTCRR